MDAEVNVDRNVLMYPLPTVKVQITQASLDESELEKLSIHSTTSTSSKLAIDDLDNPMKYELKPAITSNGALRRHSMPAFALDKMKSMLTTRQSHNPNNLNILEHGESILTRRKKSLIGLFNTIGSNLGLVSPKRSLSNYGGLDSTLNGSSGSVDLHRMRHSLGIIEIRVPNNHRHSNSNNVYHQHNNNICPVTHAQHIKSSATIANSDGTVTVPIMTGQSPCLLRSGEEIYYRPHRSFLRDILCCVCFKKHDEYDNLIESHSCARVFTVLVLVTIGCMLVGYIIKAASEKNEDPG